MEKYIYNSLSKYFNALKEEGYMSNTNIKKLIVLDILENMLNEELSNCLTDQDKYHINKYMYCIYGSGCLFDYPNKGCSRNVIFRKKDRDWVVDPIISTFWNDDVLWKDSTIYNSNKYWSDN